MWLVVNIMVLVSYTRKDSTRDKVGIADVVSCLHDRKSKRTAEISNLTMPTAMLLVTLLSLLATAPVVARQEGLCSFERCIDLRTTRSRRATTTLPTAFGGFFTASGGGRSKFPTNPKDRYVSSTLFLFNLFVCFSSMSASFLFLLPLIPSTTKIIRKK